MNVKLLVILGFLFYTITSFSQEVEQTQKVEYATITLRAYYQGNVIKYDDKKLSKTPIIAMPDGNSGQLFDTTNPENPTKFYTLNQVLNFMAQYGWVLKTSNVIPYVGDSGNNDSGLLINTNEYVQILIFERVIK